jgi:sulfite exporter TauE/SafE
MGTLNGLLPCGLVLIALSYCLTLQAPLEGFTFMMMFGAGTLPVMLGLTSIIPTLVKKFRFNMYYVTSGMLIVSGLVLIARVFIMHVPHNANIQEGVIDIVLCR